MAFDDNALAKNRFQVRTYTTPLPEDLLFFEVNDWKVPGNREGQWEYGQPHWDPKRFPNHELVYVTPADQHGNQYWYYAAKRENQDEYNFETSFADIGGQKFDAIRRTYVIKRTEFDPESPAMGEFMPNIPEDQFPTDTYVMALREQSRIQDEKLDSLYVVDVRTYVKKCSMRSLGVDALNGKMLHADDVFYAADEVVLTREDVDYTAAMLFADPTDVYWGIQEDGTQRSGKQVSCNWYLVTTEQVVGGTFTDGAVTVDSFTTNDNYYWPPVLDTFELLDWVRNDGGTDIYPAIRFVPEGYNGPCLTTITRTWAIAPFTIPVVEQMNPTRVYYACPYYTLNISECLHPLITAKCDIGTSDPVYDQNTGSARLFNATNYTTWPDTITAYDDQVPFRGGYLRTTKVVTKPAYAAAGSWT